jgi:hypothetical protein
MTNLNERLDKHLQSVREESELIAKFKPFIRINDTAEEYANALKEGEDEIYFGYVGKEIYTIITDSLLNNPFNSRVLQKTILGFNEAENELLNKAYDATPEKGDGDHYYSWDTVDDIRGTFITIEETVEILKKINTKTAKQYINGLQKLLPKIKKLWDKVPDVF